MRGKDPPPWQSGAVRRGVCQASHDVQLGPWRHLQRPNAEELRQGCPSVLIQLLFGCQSNNVFHDRRRARRVDFVMEALSSKHLNLSRKMAHEGLYFNETEGVQDPRLGPLIPMLRACDRKKIREPSGLRFRQSIGLSLKSAFDTSARISPSLSSTNIQSMPPKILRTLQNYLQRTLGQHTTKIMGVNRMGSCTIGPCQLDLGFTQGREKLCGVQLYATSLPAIRISMCAPFHVTAESATVACPADDGVYPHVILPCCYSERTATCETQPAEHKP